MFKSVLLVCSFLLGLSTFSFASPHQFEWVFQSGTAQFKRSADTAWIQITDNHFQNYYMHVRLEASDSLWIDKGGIGIFRSSHGFFMELSGSVKGTISEFWKENDKNKRTVDPDKDMDALLQHSGSAQELIHRAEAGCTRCAYYPSVGIEESPIRGTNLAKEVNEIVFLWRSFENTKQYSFSIKNIYGIEKFKINTSDTSITFSREKIKEMMEGETNVLWKVLPDNRSYTQMDEFLFQLTDVSSAQLLHPSLQKDSPLKIFHRIQDYMQQKYYSLAYSEIQKLEKIAPNAQRTRQILALLYIEAGMRTIRELEQLMKIKGSK